MLFLICRELILFVVTFHLICVLCLSFLLTVMVCCVCDRCSISKAELFRSFMQLLSEVPDSRRPDTLRFYTVFQ